MFKGRYWKEGRFWVIEVPALDVVTQGTSKDDALEMIADAVESLVNIKGFKIEVKQLNKGEFAVSSTSVTPLIALFFKRQRLKKGLTIEDMRARMHTRSRNEYYQYEQGKSAPGIEKILQILKALEIEDALSFDVSADSQNDERKVA
jgi:predicted RNase H-like HicB family nuclease